MPISLSPKDERPGFPLLVAKLTSLFLADGGCPYYRGGNASAEPTVLASLALFATGGPSAQGKALVDWVAGLQANDGTIAVDLGHPGQGTWVTSQAALAFGHYGRASNLKRALDYILSSRSVTLPDDPRTGQNDSLTGWSWVQGTFGWVEPTAWALLALYLSGNGAHPRAVEGRKFLLDRQIQSGGWNYGNPALDDKDLLPFWDTTGLSLVALQGYPEAKHTTQSVDLLEKKQESITSVCGLAWSVLGLQACGRDATRLKAKLFDAMSSLRDEELNAAHFSAGLIALSGKKVFAP